ncbi:hypothetical protein MYCTH_2113329 [Thermothelomyces thermophilus ATCC 42464]|uniref:Uncharacterized protein n=1 Tax=Thermothelomyces thermophilus (strain ATCC 42464 / BCRC 31852 / DSM 1799) TaxID=573729 RepID=G2QP98_THET4|nr:uncharacterized protein MYCTH_2113329 [Thermothelomyces thermophilus ATCC 42464]AEO61411.1 hypothetical protein MYCTH_2113329 [Thermothelomyces thermophilus ATCC 42464]
MRLVLPGPTGQPGVGWGGRGQNATFAGVSNTVKASGEYHCFPRVVEMHLRGPLALGLSKLIQLTGVYSAPFRVPHVALRHEHASSTQRYPTSVFTEARTRTEYFTLMYSTEYGMRYLMDNTRALHVRGEYMRPRNSQGTLIVHKLVDPTHDWLPRRR